ncbi:hypothetical protein [Roseimicrobium sp. ORNL1]|uniref:hypothetical protein n=1 Tax=Roseimicrobium sp. ORNL1 TaxID=2711231 RepID=UPI0013E1810A|nr:hypothetical protein [Roseimicrobium sp. ORNL1]QIF02591.1 hypothetical protein G5S37_14005 [Roseimicrobium sp. ORNL1]
MESAPPNFTISAGRERRIAPWNWIPLLIGAGAPLLLMFLAIASGLTIFMWFSLAILGATLLYFLVQCVARLVERRWAGAVFAILRFAALAFSALVSFGFIVLLSLFGPPMDHFADDLKIPEGIEIAEPDKDPTDSMVETGDLEVDDLQADVRATLAVPGSDVVEFTPYMPSLRRASTDHAKALLEYLEASPDWHVFIEQGNLFAARRWSYGGEPRDEMHGYISDFDDGARFQTRCLICLDRKQWSRYTVQHVEEGSKPVKAEMNMGNTLPESRVMIECGGVWVEIFEESSKPERRVTKVTVSALEKEFSEFAKDPEASISTARGKNRDLARRFAGSDNQPFRLRRGMQRGTYEVVYALNPGEPGWVYLKAFEVTKGTPLSVANLEDASTTRLLWSSNPAERFGAKAGFTIYEGDWGQPYAARFEVWFRPLSGKSKRKLAERNFKIEGWQH